MTKLRMDGLVSGGFKDLDMSHLTPKEYRQYQKTLKELEEVNNDNDDNPDIVEETNPNDYYQIDNLDSNKNKMKKIIVGIVIVIVVILLTTIKVPQGNNIETLRLQKISELELKTTSLSGEILELKLQIVDKEEQKLNLEKCKTDNSRVGKYIDCDLFYKK